MSTDRRWMRWLPLALLLAGCAPRLHQRHTVVLEPTEPDVVEMRYGAFEGCLLRREMPVQYRVQRPDYRLQFEVGSSPVERSPSLAVVLQGDGRLQARFPGLSSAPSAQALDGGQRYVLAADTLPASDLRVEVLRDDAVLGREQFAVRRESCRALSLGEKGG